MRNKTKKRNFVKHSINHLSHLSYSPISMQQPITLPLLLSYRFHRNFVVNLKPIKHHHMRFNDDSQLCFFTFFTEFNLFSDNFPHTMERERELAKPTAEILLEIQFDLLTAGIPFIFPPKIFQLPTSSSCYSSSQLW